MYKKILLFSLISLLFVFCKTSTKVETAAAAIERAKSELKSNADKFDYSASLVGDVWYIKLTQNGHFFKGGPIEIHISQENGKILDIISQK